VELLNIGHDVLNELERIIARFTPSLQQHKIVKT